MLKKLAAHAVQQAKKARETAVQQSNSKADKTAVVQEKKSGRAQISLDWIDQALQKLFANRSDKSLDSRIRFQIQDVMD